MQLKLLTYYLVLIVLIELVKQVLESTGFMVTILFSMFIYQAFTSCLWWADCHRLVLSYTSFLHMSTPNLIFFAFFFLCPFTTSNSLCILNFYCYTSYSVYYYFSDYVSPLYFKKSSINSTSLLTFHVF